MPHLSISPIPTDSTKHSYKHNVVQVHLEMRKHLCVHEAFNGRGGGSEGWTGQIRQIDYTVGWMDFMHGWRHRRAWFLRQHAPRCKRRRWKFRTDPTAIGLMSPCSFFGMGQQRAAFTSRWATSSSLSARTRLKAVASSSDRSSSQSNHERSTRNERPSAPPELPGSRRRTALMYWSAVNWSGSAPAGAGVWMSGERRRCAAVWDAWKRSGQSPPAGAGPAGR